MPKSRTKTAASGGTPYSKKKSSRSGAMAKSNKRQQSAAPQKPILDILREEAAERVTKPVYFWKPNAPFGFLGHWYETPEPMVDPETGIEFNCCEQYMMYQKARTFNDDASAAAVMATKDPKEHKAIGRRVIGFTDHEWDAVKRKIVVDANMLKFSQGMASKTDQFVYLPSPLVNGGPKQSTKALGKEENEVSLKELLLATGDRELAEASPRDRIWGVGFGAERAEQLRVTCKEKWGTNYLGKALMEVRDKIRAEESRQPVQVGETA